MPKPLTSIGYYLMLLSLLLCDSAKTKAQDVAVSETISVDVEIIGIEQGLSQGLIIAMVEDHDGYLWFGTKDGLNRYDGSKITVFRNDPDNPQSIAENYISTLLVDDKNRLWIGTLSKGVDLYDRETGKFIHFRKGVNGLRLDTPAHLFSNPENNIGVWYHNVNTMDIIIESDISLPTDRANFTVVAFENMYPGFKDENINLKNEKTINKLHECRQRFFSADGTFWDINNCDFILGYNPAALLGNEAPQRVQIAISKTVSYDNLYQTHFLSSDKNELYVCDGLRTILKYNSEKKALKPFVNLPEGFSFSGQVIIDKDGIFWAEQDAQLNILKIDPINEKLSIVELKNISTLGITSSMLHDSNGNLWIPTYGNGAYQISSRRQVFKHIGLDESRNLPTWILRTEMQGKKNHSIGEIALNYKKTITTSFPSILKKRTSFIPDNLVIDNDGYYWFSHNTIDHSTQIPHHFLIKHNPNENKHEIIEIKVPVYSNNSNLSQIFLDLNGDIWYCFASEFGSAVLGQLNVKTNETKLYTLPTKTETLQYRYMSDWWVENDNSIWLATINGVFHFQPQNEVWNHYKFIENTENSLSSNITLSICPDSEHPEQYVWVGTEGGGLNKLNRKSGQFTHYTTEHGLPNNVIYGILSDQKNNLWLSTNYGLCLFNPKTLEVRNFTAADGLNGNEFNRYEYSKSEDGTMYFGGIEGATYFNPKDLYSEIKPSKIVINGLKILNKAIEYGALNSFNYYLPTPIEHCKELQFDYDIRMISLTFSLLDLTVPTQNQFKYMLEGFDKDWIDAGNMNEATYTNLNAGTYTFKVMGKNSNNIWSEERNLQIRVLPPWWGTWWFRTIAVIVFASILYGLYRYRMAHLIGMERMRNRIAQDLHDEIGSTLSSISLYSAVMQKSTNNLPPKTTDILGKIIDSTSEVMEKMNDMVWTIKSDNDDFEQVVNRMRAFAVNMTDTTGITLHFIVGQKTESVKLDMNRRKNIYLIFKEAVNNAVKYSKCNNLYVTLTKNINHLTLEILDDGIGFDLSNDSDKNDLLGGNGVAGMKFRAKELNADFNISSVLSEGTTIKLDIPINH